MKKLTLFVLLLASINFVSCNQEKVQNQKSDMAQAETKTEAPGFIHTVYFWLKKDNPELLKEFKEEALPKLATVPSILSVSWGPPAGTPREVVDNSYDMSWIVTFKNAADQDEYQVDPIHTEFVELYKSLFERVQVYDSNITNFRTAESQNR